MTPPSAGEEPVRRGPVEHFAGTGARTVLRAPRNAVGLLPILANTSAHFVTPRDDSPAEGTLSAPLDQTHLPLRGDGLLGGLRHDAKLAQDARNVVIATLLDDLATLVEPCEGSALQLNAAVRRRKNLA